ncbi:unnamed protein product [Mytilus edulis]|uniref:Retrotransposon gag domain-containing protein n=1 Tax=Mytilus edulis TaxID=6550 RepID=A0A8S3VES0_MYTED|nr:unnamed protein product [Mytilus edulis]
MAFRMTPSASSEYSPILSCFWQRHEPQKIYKTLINQTLQILSAQPNKNHQQQPDRSRTEPEAEQQIVPINPIGLTTNTKRVMSSINLAHFRDENSQVLAIWWTMFENYIKLQNYQNEAALAAFSFHVEGQASTWYHSLPTATRDDLTNLKAAFLDRFKHHNTNNELYRLKTTST